MGCCKINNKHIDYKKLEEFKALFDSFYNSVMVNREKVNPEKYNL